MYTTVHGVHQRRPLAYGKTLPKEEDFPGNTSAIGRLNFTDFTDREPLASGCRLSRHGGCCAGGFRRTGPKPVKRDIQAALTVIGRRVVIGKGAPDLSQARIQSADLFSPVFKECLDALFVWSDPPMNQHDVHMAVRPFYSFYSK